MDNMLSLDSLAIAINAAHERCQRSYVTMLSDARSTGELLLQAKAQLPHGQWTAWLTSNCAFSDRTAQRYMQIANSWDSLQSKTATVADLGVRLACEMIAHEKVLDKPEEQSNLPRAFVPKPTHPDIRPGDRIKVTDESSPEYGQELEVSEVVQDAIALFKKGDETYPLLVNQVEVVDRPTPLQPSEIKPLPKGGTAQERLPQNAPASAPHAGAQPAPNGGTKNCVLTPPSLPQKSLALYESPKNNNDGEEQMRIQQEILGKSILSQNSRRIQSTNTFAPITVAALQDVLRRILDECGEYLPQELIDEARELL